MMKKVVLASLIISGAAFAGDPKAGGAPAVPADAKKAPPDAKPPGPPQELADMAKAMAGTWKCTGKADMGGTLGDIKGTITHKADLDGFWIVSSLNATAAKGTMHGTFMTTYDAGAKKFYRQTANSHGGHGTAWGTMTGTKMAWEGDAHFMGKDMKIRGSEEIVSPKETHVSGEYSDDGGKTWKPDHDVTCKK
jgi:hypothetical protein